MGAIDYLILLFTIISLVEIINESRQKKWFSAFVSAAIFFFLVYIGRGIYVYLWQSVAGGP